MCDVDPDFTGRDGLLPILCQSAASAKPGECAFQSHRKIATEPNVDADVARFLADGAYDGQGVGDCLVSRFGPEFEIVIPPPKNAILGDNPRRNQHVEDIATHGRMKWQEDSSYGQRSIFEAQIGRWKQVIGTALRARNFGAQTCEINIAAKALNRMKDLGRAQFEQVS